MRAPEQQHIIEESIPFFLFLLGVVALESVPGPEERVPSRSPFSLAESSSSMDDCGWDAWELSLAEWWLADDISEWLLSVWLAVVVSAAFVSAHGLTGSDVSTDLFPSVCPYAWVSSALATRLIGYRSTGRDGEQPFSDKFGGTQTDTQTRQWDIQTIPLRCAPLPELASRSGRWWHRSPAIKAFGRLVIGSAEGLFSGGIVMGEGVNRQHRVAVCSVSKVGQCCAVWRSGSGWWGQWRSKKFLWVKKSDNGKSYGRDRSPVLCLTGKGDIGRRARKDSAGELWCASHSSQHKVWATEGSGLSASCRRIPWSWSCRWRSRCGP